jgi:hypothetical protein
VKVLVLTVALSPGAVCPRLNSRFRRHNSALQATVGYAERVCGTQPSPGGHFAGNCHEQSFAGINSIILVAGITAPVNMATLGLYHVSLVTTGLPC